MSTDSNKKHNETKISFEDIKFAEINNKGIQTVRAFFLKWFYFDIPKEELEKISKFKVKDNCLFFDANEKRTKTKFNIILEQGFNSLKSIFHNRNAIYIHRNSDLPLIGTNFLGLVDRGSNLIEVKPSTGCNLSCIYCSVKEGDNSKLTDFIVEKDFLVEEFKKLAAIKKHPVEAHINTHGETLLYGDIVDLVKDLKKIKNVETISINTNGVILTKDLVDELAEAGLTRLNFSIDTINPELGKKLSNIQTYHIDKIKEIFEYATTKLDTTIAPIIVPKINEDMTELIDFALDIRKKTEKIRKHKQLTPIFGIQNFLNYPRGRNPVKQWNWDQFYQHLEKYTQKYGIEMRIKPEDFNIYADASPSKPFKKGQIIEVIVVCKGRYPNEFLARANERAITIKSSKDLKTGKKVKIKITRSKHNIFNAVPA